MDLITVAQFNFRHEAEFAQGFLENAGIDSQLQIDDAGGAEMGLAFSNPARLVVRAEDAAEARDILVDAGFLKD